MAKKSVTTDNAPKAIGPYSQAIQVDNLLFCSGQIPINPKTGELVRGEIENQTEQVMKNLAAVLQEAGASFENVVKSTIFLKNFNDFSKVNEVYGSFLREPYPARATVEVARLPLDVDVEIEMIAKLCK